MSRETSLLTSAIGAIGSTPLVELSRITKDLDGTILAKLDYLNPGFSKKDRIARQIIQDAEDNGDLAPGQTIKISPDNPVFFDAEGVRIH